VSTGSVWMRRARLSLTFALGVVILGLGVASVVLDHLTHQPGTGGPAADALVGAAGVVPATAVGTLLAEGKELREFSGRQYVLEEALAGDVALIEAWEADRWGNLTYKSSARNFNPVMAMAAKLTIAQAQHIVDLGVLDPEQVPTPGIFVQRVVHVPYGEPTVT